jgi:hypothetical protein
VSNSRTGDIDRGAIVLLFDLRAGLLHALRFLLLRRRRVNVTHADVRDGRVIDFDPGYLGRVFEQTLAGQAPSVHGDIDLANLRIERAERHVGDSVLRDAFS